jgi:pyrroline-5-carboxylate reductase
LFNFDSLFEIFIYQKIFVMKKNKISIIGGGNLGSAIAKGLLLSKNYKPESITVTRNRINLLKGLADKGINVHTDNVRAVNDGDVIILAVKPKKIDIILNEIKTSLTPEKILVSAVTGVSIKHIHTVIDEKITVFRVMPNTAIAIRESMTCISTNNGNKMEADVVKGIFDELGRTVMINEELIDASTVLAACGIAYALRFIRAASQGGIQIGFDAATAQIITSQTVKGAASLLIEGGLHPEQEIDKVTTPRGITIAGLNEMEHKGFSSSLIKGILTSFENISKK